MGGPSGCRVPWWEGAGIPPCSWAVPNNSSEPCSSSPEEPASSQRAQTLAARCGPAAASISPGQQVIHGQSSRPRVMLDPQQPLLRFWQPRARVPTHWVHPMGSKT